MKMERSDVEAPTGDELPKMDLQKTQVSSLAADGSGIQVSVSETQNVYNYWSVCSMGRENITDAKLLIKAFGKCTTDHISMQDHGCVSVDI
jgi:aconitate hydratase